MKPVVYKNKINNKIFSEISNKLFELHSKDCEKIKEIISNDEEFKTPVKLDKTKYIDNDSTVNIRVWVDGETKILLNILYNACNNETIIINLNNRMIKNWLCGTSGTMSMFFYKAKEVSCPREHHLTIKVKNKVWNDFTSRCEILNISIPVGFKTCIGEFISTYF